MKISKEVLDVWVLIPTIVVDFDYKEFGISWLKWMCVIAF